MLPVLKNNNTARQKYSRNKTNYAKQHRTENNTRAMTFADRIGAEENFGNAGYKKSRLSPKQHVVEEDFNLD